MCTSTPCSAGSAISCADDLVGKKIGMHIDSYELTACLLSHATDHMDRIAIRVDERASKVAALLAGEVDAIQIYSCYEAIELEDALGAPANVVPLSSLTRPGAEPFPLGYGQVRMTVPHGVAVEQTSHRTARRNRTDKIGVVIELTKPAPSFYEKPRAAIESTKPAMPSSLQSRVPPSSWQTRAPPPSNDTGAAIE